MGYVSPQQFAHDRSVSVDAVLRNEFDFRGYPYRHIVLLGVPAGLSGNVVPPLLAAIERLAQFGWELVNVTSVSNQHRLHAFMRLR
ncbi:hypothetical protein [Micromonospora zamorensis]|uniref:hypothetical protein n=1 Tax=Micromonospora zamorensis TaxID=709883 RepID=UPI0037A189D1